MDEQRKSLFVTAIITLLILALIIGVIIYLVRFIQGRQNANKITSNNTTITRSAAPNSTIFNPSEAPVASANPSIGFNYPPASAVPGLPAGDNELYSGNGFQVKYPKNWGLLTCNNSANFEFDPTSNVDQIGVVCDYAIKPITILEGGNPNCQGENVTLGNVSVIRSKVIDDNGADYRWCTKTSPVLDITHRVSKTPARAASQADYSADVEKMIQNTTFVSGS